MGMGLLALVEVKLVLDLKMAEGLVVLLVLEPQGVKEETQE